MTAHRASEIAPLATLLGDFGADVPTVADVLAWRARQHPDAPAFRFLRHPGPPEALSFGELQSRVEAWAAAIAERTKTGDRVILFFQPGLDSVAAFLGCQRSGTVPVPMSLPRAKERQDRVAAVTANCRPALMLTHRDARTALSDTHIAVPVLDKEDLAADAAPSRTSPRRTELAFLQYTSGSTGLPKGVKVTHGNVLANIQDIIDSFRLTTSIRGVSWLPTYHDMGLIGCVLTPILVGGEKALMAPASFLRDPLRWLDAIAKHRAEISGGPNFAFDACARRLLDEASRPDPQELDLSCWRVAFVGAEPVRAAMLMRFAAAAAPYGFRPDAFLPCYGLAEGTLYVSGITGAPGRLISHFDTDALGQGKARIAPRGDDEKASRRLPLVACGDAAASADTEIVIVDPETGAEVADEEVGEIWVSGPGVASGYWEHPTATDAVFGQLLPGRTGSFLRTGDLGFRSRGKLFIAGRLRDLIIINGVKYHPEDIEHTIGTRLPEFAGGRAIFAIESVSGVRVVVLQELSRAQRRSAAIDELAAGIRAAVWEAHAVAVAEVLLLAPGTLPMTSSGKIQRQRCRELYLAGEIVGLDLPSTPRAAASPEAPSTAAALKLRAILSEVMRLRVDEIELDRPLSSLGLDSLKTIEVQILAESRMGWEIPGEALHSDMTVLEIAERRPTAEGVNPGVFWMDAALPETLLPPAGVPDLTGDVLVTGATGLVGANIVRELIARTDANIFCLVRADSDAAAQERLVRHLVTSGAVASASAVTKRVRSVRGDAALPQFGLAPERFAELSERVAVVFNNAAKLDFVSPYGGLRAVNVASVRSVLEFAALRRAKLLAHTSSISVLESPVRGVARVAEDVPLDFPESLAIGYAQTKWVSDALVLHARARGFAASVFRPPWIVGPADVTASGDFVPRFLDGCRRIGALPDSQYRWDLVPADHVARAIVALVWADRGNRAVYHLGATRRLSVAQLASRLRQLGADLDVIPIDEWRARLRTALASDPENPLRPVAGLFLKAAAGRVAAESYLLGQVPEMDSRRTWARLRELGFADPPAPDELVATLLRTAIRPPALVAAAAD